MAPQRKEEETKDRSAPSPKKMGRNEAGLINDPGGRSDESHALGNLSL